MKHTVLCNYIFQWQTIAFLVDSNVFFLFEHLIVSRSFNSLTLTWITHLLYFK